MLAFYKIINSDYKQRTRSYAFLITLAISLYAAYSFIPPESASYSTVRIGNYIGVQNSAWIAYVTAIMSSTFICWIGFYLVNSGIKKDIDTGVGMIVATTSVSNFQYLLAKTFSNFLVLLSILACAFVMCITVFFIRHSGYPFEPLQFITPFAIITVPAIFFFSALAVIAEVFLYRFTVLMNVGFFFFFCFLASLQLKITPAFDVIGVKPVTIAMQQTVARRFHDTSTTLSIGFNFSSKDHFHHFVFEGINWTSSVILARLLLMGLAVLLVFISSRFFHRFEIKEKIKVKKILKVPGLIEPLKPLHEIKLSELPAIIPDYEILPFIKTEFVMLFRKGPLWLWLINLGGMIALIFVPIKIGHQIILPILWFLQVGRLSDLATKEKTNRIHYFTYAAYRPLSRLFPAQILAGIILTWGLALPLLIKYLFAMQPLPLLSILLGGAFIVLFAVSLGILSGGKKLFEILFFLITYANIEMVPYTDYFGGLNTGQNYILFITVFIGLLTGLSFLLRKLELQRI